MKMYITIHLCDIKNSNCEVITNEENIIEFYEKFGSY